LGPSRGTAASCAMESRFQCIWVKRTLAKRRCRIARPAHIRVPVAALRRRRGMLRWIEFLSLCCPGHRFCSPPLKRPGLTLWWASRRLRISSACAPPPGPCLWPATSPSRWSGLRIKRSNYYSFMSGEQSLPNQSPPGTLMESATAFFRRPVQKGGCAPKIRPVSNKLWTIGG